MDNIHWQPKNARDRFVVLLGVMWGPLCVPKTMHALCILDSTFTIHSTVKEKNVKKGLVLYLINKKTKDPFPEWNE